MLQRTYGYVPIDPVRLNDPMTSDASEVLKSIKTSGGFLVHVTGLGKTDTACLFASQSALYASDANGHKPTLIVVPNGAVFAQW